MKGIPFSGDSVPALLNTQLDVWPAEAIDPSLPRKWQTRRVMKPQPEMKRGLWRWRPKKGVDINLSDMPDLAAKFAPYGQPGDLLYLQETWQVGHLTGGRPKRFTLLSETGSSDCDGTLFYKADGHADVPSWRSPVTDRKSVV